MCIIAAYWGYSTWGEVTVYSSSVLGVKWLCNLAVYLG